MPTIQDGQKFNHKLSPAKDPAVLESAKFS
jgi:hypothetical protein